MILRFIEFEQPWCSAITLFVTTFFSLSPPSGHTRKYPVFPDCGDVLRECYVPDLSQAVPGFV